ncbi:MAG: hypothetical protein FWD85_04115 [Microbacteriaceae bacterium]|nr:hypothetical protein [Microbacteriaceae bacterium]MCL2794473.1 hypothetical protein [Microbacteriaceae bacterium]
MTFDPFRPDDAGDESATYQPKHARSGRVRLWVGVIGVLLLVVAGAIAVAITRH